MNRTKPTKIQLFHLLIWLAGTAFLLMGVFHDNLWFDESYTAGLVRQEWGEILPIAAADVHPPLYYLLLKLFVTIFGDSLVVMRIFSVLCASLLAGIGYTHLRKDFGERFGLTFTAIAFLLPWTFKYASEIRMYTLAPYLVMVAAIYAYRWYKSGFSSKKDKLLFALFSVLCAYTHYYGFAAAGALNLMLLVEASRQKKFRDWLSPAALQILAYIPGFIFLLLQSSKVIGGFWIQIIYPNFVFETLSFFFLGGMLEDSLFIGKRVYIIYNIAALLFWYICYVVLKRRRMEESAFRTNPAMLALKVFGIVLAFFFIVSIKRPLYHVRYISVLAGLIIFILAYCLEKIEAKQFKGVLLLALALICATRTFSVMTDVFYSPDNRNLEYFIAENIREGDIVVSRNEMILSVVSAKDPEVRTYFFTSEENAMKEAYRAFKPGMVPISSFDEIGSGRVWVLGFNEHDRWIVENVTEKTGKQVTYTADSFYVAYHGMGFTFLLME